MNINNVPLLPALVKRAQDAARAVKDGVHVMVHQVADNLLTQLLNLQHFAVTSYAVEQDRSGAIVHLFCHLTIDVGIRSTVSLISKMKVNHSDSSLFPAT